MHPAENTFEPGQMETSCLWALQAGQGDISGIDKGEQLTVVVSGAFVVSVALVVAIVILVPNAIPPLGQRAACANIRSPGQISQRSSQKNLTRAVHHGMRR